MGLLDILTSVVNFIASLPALVQVGVGVPMMLFGAEWLVRGSVALAQRMGVSTLVIGLTIVAAGTSAPELVVNVMAAVSGNTGLTFGNVIGSNIANIGLIVGIGALIMPLVAHSRIVRTELPWLIVISAAMVVIALPLSGVGMVDGWGRVEGVLMIVGFVTLLAFWYRSARRGDEAPVTAEATEAAAETRNMSAATALGIFATGLALLLIGGRLTELGAVKTAAWFNLSHALIGMTVLAVSTSLPELITVIVACRKGHTDLAVGNVVGSNLFNILLIMGVTATITPVPIPESVGWQDLAAMMVFSLLLWWFAVTQNRTVLRLEGVVLLGLYIAYITWTVLRELVFNSPT